MTVVQKKTNKLIVLSQIAVKQINNSVEVWHQIKFVIKKIPWEPSYIIYKKIKQKYLLKESKDYLDYKIITVSRIY